MVTTSNYKTLFLTYIWFSGPFHRKRCRMPNWTRSSTSRKPGNCDWCKGVVHLSMCSCCSPAGGGCQQPKSVPVSPHSYTATAEHTLHPAASGLDTHVNLMNIKLYVRINQIMLTTPRSTTPSHPHFSSNLKNISCKD